jgi:hypothetical protein
VTPPPQPPPTVSIDAGVVEATVAKPVNIDLTSTPEGAEIYVNGADTGKTAPATLTLPHDAKPAMITLKLHGYADAEIPNVALDGGNVTKAATLKKLATTTTPPTTHTPTTHTPTTHTPKAHPDDLEPP